METINKIFYIYKNRFKKVFIYSSINNVLFLFVTLYSLQVLDRVIGSGNSHTLALMSIVLLFIFICILLSGIFSHYNISKVNQQLDKEILLYTSQHSLKSISEYLIRLRSFLFGPSIRIALDAIWSAFYVIILFLIHPYIGFSAIVGITIVAGFAYIKIITTNRSIREVTEFDSKDANWYYVIQQIVELIIIVSPLPIPISLILGVGYSWFKFYTLSKALNLSNKPYSNHNLSKFYRFLKAWLTINIKIICSALVTGVGAYIVVSTNAQELTTGGMIVSSIIIARVLIVTDNTVLIWQSICSAYKVYLSLAKLTRVTN